MTSLEELKKPFNIVTLTLTIISLGLSVIFYYNGKKEKKLSFQLNEPSSLIFDSKNSSSKIKLLEKESVLITDNVYLLTGKIWNSGDISLTKSDVRKSITIDLLKAKRILDFKLVKQKDASIAKFKLDKLTNNSLGLDWEYFDPGYGLSFQIMYIGEEDPGFNLSGIILDIPSFNKIKQSPKEDWRITIAGLVAYSLMIILLIWRLLKRKNIKGAFDKIYLTMLIICVFVVIYIIKTRLMNGDIPI